jgi:glycosyltransferase involved in cell wall biosynthesis
MRIAIVSDYFNDFVGGAQTSMHEQFLALTAAGHHVVMVSAGRGRRGGRVRRRENGLELQTAFTLPGVQLPVIPNNEHTVAALESYFREQAIDVVHVQTEFGLAHAAATVAERLSLPVVHTVHTFYWSSQGVWHAALAPFIRFMLVRVIRWSIPRKSLSRRPVDNLLRNLTLAMALRADTVVSPSKHQAQDLAAAGVSAPAIVSNPISTSPRPAVELTLDKANQPRFVWAARCEPVKRPLEFARAAIDALQRTGGGFSVDFVGDGSELAALRRLTAPYAQLRVHGALPHEAVLDLMDAASAVALTSIGFDNQPMTVAESVSRERGVLYCDPRLGEGLGASGFLAANPRVDGLADALVALVSDPSLLVGLSVGAAREKVEFSPTRYVERILEVYSR